MNHRMKLKPEPFELMAAGKKTIELRLFDHKRQKIAVGDSIILSCADGGEITAEVIQLHVFESFSRLYAALPLEKCGYLPEECATATAADMLAYYTAQQQKQFGVVGIELSIISVRRANR